jgi:hypothetical protein
MKRYGVVVYAILLARHMWVTWACTHVPCVRLLGSVVLFAPRPWLHLQMITAVLLSSSSYSYSRLVFIFWWLQPFCCLHLQVVTAVSLFSSSDGYSRFIVFIFRSLQPFRYHLQMVIAVSLSSSSDGYNCFDCLHLQMVNSRFVVFIFRWLQPFRCLHLQMVIAVWLSSSSGRYSRFVVFIFSWLQPFRCLHLHMVTAVLLLSSSYGYRRFVVFIFSWLQPFRCLHLHMVTAVLLSSSSYGYRRFVVFIFRWLQPFRCLHLHMVTAVPLSSSSNGYSRFDCLPKCSINISWCHLHAMAQVWPSCNGTGMTYMQWHRFDLRRYRSDEGRGGPVLGCTKTYRILNFLLWALSDWITSFLQKAVFWISVMRSGSISPAVSGLPLVGNPWH